MPWMNRVNEMRDRFKEILTWVDVRNVRSEQFNPAFADELPLVSFYFADEDVADDRPRPIIRRRKLPVNIDICRMCDQNQGLDEWLYERAFEVEQAVDNSNLLGFPYVHDLVLNGTIPGQISVTNETQVRVLRVRYTIDYETQIVPFSSLEEFLKFRANYDIDQNQTEFEAIDHVTIRRS